MRSSLYTNSSGKGVKITSGNFKKRGSDSFRNFTDCTTY